MYCVAEVRDQQIEARRATRHRGAARADADGLHGEISIDEQTHPVDRKQDRGADVQQRQHGRLHEPADEPGLAALGEEQAVQDRLEHDEDADDVARKRRSGVLTIFGNRSRRCLRRNARYSASRPFASSSNACQVIRVVDGANAEVADGALAGAFDFDSQLGRDDRVADAAVVELERGSVLLGGFARAPLDLLADHELVRVGRFGVFARLAVGALLARAGVDRELGGELLDVERGERLNTRLYGVAGAIDQGQ